MGGALFRASEALRRPGAVSPLPEDGEVSVAIGLENHSAAIRSPDRETVAPFERKTAHRFVRCHVVEPARAWTIGMRGKGNSPPIRRDARRHEGADRNIEA